MLIDALLALLFLLLLVSPLPIFVVAWVRSPRFYKQNDVGPRQKTLYLAALAFASTSGVAYVGFWCWWTAKLYHFAVPFWAELMLERFMLASVLFCTVAILCLVGGRGPYRVLVGLAIAWVMYQLWGRSIIHWA